MISSSQRPLPDKTQQSQQTNIHAPRRAEDFYLPLKIRRLRPGKLYADTGTRTNVVCFRKVLSSRVNALGYLRVQNIRWQWNSNRCSFCFRRVLPTRVNALGYLREPIYRCSQISVYDKDKGHTGIIMCFYIIIVTVQDCCNFFSKYSALTFNNMATKNRQVSDVCCLCKPAVCDDVEWIWLTSDRFQWRISVCLVRIFSCCVIYWPVEEMLAL